MSVRIKTLIVISLTFPALLGILYFTSRWFILHDAVKDTGAGLLPENMVKLFEPLFTTKLKGIGLGLVVSRKLAEANGGRIEVQSEPGKGSTFTVCLPVYNSGSL